MTVAFVLLAPVVEGAGFPPIAGLLLAILVVLVPFKLAVVVRAGRGRAGGVRSIVPYRRPLPIRDWAWLVSLLVVAAFVGFGLSMAFEPAVIGSLFAWLPDWFVRPIDPDRVRDFSREAWLLTLGMYLVLNGFVGPIVEELYFRGYVLPRMEWLGRWAPLVNVSLFSLYRLCRPAGRRQDPGLRADGLRRALEGERVPRDGRPLLAQHARHHPRRRHGLGRL